MRELLEIACWTVGGLFVLFSAMAAWEIGCGRKEEAQRISAQFLPAAWGVLALLGAMMAVGMFWGGVYRAVMWLAGGR